MALVLYREEGQAVEIDGGIKITVVDVKGKGVRLAVVAPREANIWRSELDANGRRGYAVEPRPEKE